MVAITSTMFMPIGWLEMSSCPCACHKAVWHSTPVPAQACNAFSHLQQQQYSAKMKTSNSMPQLMDVRTHHARFQQHVTKRATQTQLQKQKVWSDDQ